MSDKYITIGGVDMTVNKPCPMQYAKGGKPAPLSPQVTVIYTELKGMIV